MQQRKWLKHLCPMEDGYSDPPGIKVRPCEGLGAIDYLSHNPLTKVQCARRSSRPELSVGCTLNSLILFSSDIFASGPNTR